MGEKIVNQAYVLALYLQRFHPDWDWVRCCQTAIDQVRYWNS